MNLTDCTIPCDQSAQAMVIPMYTEAEGYALKTFLDNPELLIYKILSQTT